MIADTPIKAPILRPSDAENLAGIETGRDTLSHTKLSTFLACQRRFELHYDRRLSLIEERTPLALGKAYQKAIELQDPEAGPMILDGYEQAPCRECSETGKINGYACEDCLGAGYFWKPPVEPLTFYVQEAEDRHRVHRATVRAAAALYLRTWPEGSGETREVEYRVRLRNPWTGAFSQTFDLLGYADGVVDNTLPGAGGGRLVPGSQPGTFTIAPLELIENKLVGRIDSAKVQRLPLDAQLALARYGLWRATGRHVQKVHYRWIKKPSIKQRAGRKADKSDAESIDQFVERLEADYVERPEFYVHEEQPQWATTEDLLRIEAELWMWAEQVRAMRRQRLAPRSTARCTDFGGCQFLPKCTGDPDAGSLYRVRPVRDEPIPAEASEA